MLTANFNAMVAEVRGMLERERSFTRYASHELRTPLSTLKAQLEALELGLMPPEQVMPTMQHALADTETILGALLQLSRLEQPRLEPLPLSDVMGQLEQHIENDRVRFHMPADVWLLSHSDLLNQVLSNLINNALKYSDGHVDVCANQQADTRAEAVTISVRDYGAGVPEDVLAKLTTPFFRVQGSRAKGWGLGLALSEHIVRSLGGEITFGNVSAKDNVYAEDNVYAKDVEAERDAVSAASYGVIEGFVARVTLPLYDETAPSGQTPQTEKTLPKTSRETTSRETSQGKRLT
jgi:signal transduction histidine kinase